MEEPVYPMLVLGSRKARTGQGEQHAPSSVPCASSRRNTGSLPRHAKARGEAEGGDPRRNADVPERWRMGRRSLHVGKPRTPGCGRTAKAPRLSEGGSK